MKKCYLCEVSEEDTFLYTGVHKESGIVSVCRNCYFRNKLPLIDKKEINQEELEKRESVRDRLSRMAGVRKKEIEEPFRRHKIKPEDIGLKNIVDKNVRKDLVPASDLKEDLVENFHWVIMRKRRAKRLSREELASAIQESPSVIEIIEQEAKLPRDYVSLIKKIENCLGVVLLIDKRRKVSPQDLLLESKVPSGIMIGDIEKDENLYLEDLDLEKIKEISGEVKQDRPSKEINKRPLKELSDEEIERLIFGN